MYGIGGSFPVWRKAEMGNLCKAENGNLRIFEAEIGIQTWAETENRQITKAEIGNKYLKVTQTRRKSGNRHPGKPPCIDDGLVLDIVLYK